MDWLTFIAALVDHLAWPLAVTVLFLTYRAPISERIRALRKLKYQDLEFDLGEQLQQLGEKAEVINELQPMPSPLQLPPGTAQTQPPLLDQAKAVMNASPVAAVLLAWAALEQALNQTVMRLAVSPDPPSRLNAVVSMELLQNAKRLTETSAELINGLRRIRNTLAHPPQHGEVRVSEADAQKYIQIVEGLIRGLESKTR